MTCSDSPFLIYCVVYKIFLSISQEVTSFLQKPPHVEKCTVQAVPTCLSTACEWWRTWWRQNSRHLDCVSSAGPMWHLWAMKQRSRDPPRRQPAFSDHKSVCTGRSSRSWSAKLRDKLTKFKLHKKALKSPQSSETSLHCNKFTSEEQRRAEIQIICDGHLYSSCFAKSQTH